MILMHVYHNPSYLNALFIRNACTYHYIIKNYIMSHSKAPCGTILAVSDKESVSHDCKQTLGVDLATKLLLFVRACLSQPHFCCQKS